MYSKLDMLVKITLLDNPQELKKKLCQLESTNLYQKASMNDWSDVEVQ